MCVKIKEFSKAVTLLKQALEYKPYSESRKYRLDLDYLLTTTYFLAGDYSKAFDSYRLIMMHERNENINGIAIWNLFTQVRISLTPSPSILLWRRSILSFFPPKYKYEFLALNSAQKTRSILRFLARHVYRC